MARAARILIIALTTASWLTFTASPSQADTTWLPPAGTWNGYKIYVSKACHDGNDGVPGGPCITNHGCGTYTENSESSTMATTTAVGTGSGGNLIQRGYKARKGEGTAGGNISNSNAWGANMHIPLHTNAGAMNCGATNPAGKGTLALWYDQADLNCGNILYPQVGQVSPGTSDGLQWRDDVGELRTNAVTCYLEAEFHTWNTGVNWIYDEVNWTWRIGQTVDLYFNWP